MADAGYRLAVEGEKEFKKALAEINAQIKVNKSELKLLTAEYEINDDKLGNLQKKQGVLASTMQEQAEKVRVAEERYKAWAAELGEGDTKVLRLKESLNLAKTELAATTAEWEKNEEQIRRFANVTEEIVSAENRLKAEMEELNGGLQVNESQMKLVQAQYKGAEDASEGLRKQNEILADSIDKQNSKVALLKQALSDAADVYGENSEEVRDYQIQLNNAQAELAEMTDKVEENNKALQEDVGGGFDGLQDGLDGIIDSLGIDMPAGIDKVISGITGAGGMVSGFGLAAAGVGAIITAVKNLNEDIKEAASRSSEIIDTASIYGISTSELQEWQYAAPSIGVEVEAVADAFKELKNRMYEARNGNEEYLETFRRLGVEIEDGNGELRDTSDVFDELMVRYSGVSNETERAAMMMEMFGEEAQKLMPIITKGTSTVEAYKEQAHELGFVLSEELLEAMDKVDRKMQRQTLLVEAENAAWANMWHTLGQMVTGKASFDDFTEARDLWFDTQKGAWENLTTDVEESLEEIAEAEQQYSMESIERFNAMFETESAELQASLEERTELLEKANQEELEQFQKSQEKQQKAFEKTQSAELKAFQKTQSQRKKEFQAALDAEMDALDEAHKKKLEQINEEYTERIKLVDEDRYKALQAIEGMIADLDKLTEAEEKAEEERKKREAIAEAEDAIARAETAEEREQAEKEYNDLLAEHERERVLAEREAQRQRYENMLLSVNEEYDRRVEEIEKEVSAKEQQAEDEYTVAKTALEEEHAMRQELFDEQMTNELDAFKENQQAQKDAFKETLDLQAKDHEQYLSDKLTREQKELEDEILAEEDAARRKRDIRIQYEQESISTMERLNDDYVKELNKTLTNNLPFLDRGNIDLSGLTQIPKYASGTLRHPGGLAIVGEEGPELVSLPAGAAVFPNSTLRSMGSGDTVNNWYVTVSAADVREFNDIVRLAQTRRQDIRMARTEG